MQILNKTKKEALCKEYTVYRSIWQQARGLMFSRKRNLVFEFRAERREVLHCYFVFFPINVLFLDTHKKVREIARINPFEVYVPGVKAKYIIELYRDIGSTQVGDTLIF